MLNQNGDKTKGNWNKLYRQRCRLLPTLGAYKIVAQQRLQKMTTEMTVNDEIASNKRDIFTKTVKHLGIPRSGVPDIRYLRSKGYCLPTEAEILQSQRIVHNLRKVAYADYLHCQRPKKPLPIIKVQTVSELTFSDYNSLTDWAEKKSSYLSNAIARRSSANIRHAEFMRQMSARRQMEAKIMHSKMNVFQKRIQQNLTNARPSEEIVRRTIYEALDNDHRKDMPHLRSLGDKKVDSEIRYEKFERWKTSMMKVLDHQAKSDLEMVTRFRKFLQPTTLTGNSRWQARRSTIKKENMIRESVIYY